MAITLPELPYEKGALEPYISSKTIEFHYGKHHQAYVTNTNNLIQNTHLEQADLETIIKESASDPSKQGIFNNSAQVWNHTFYWHSMKPKGGGEPSQSLMDKITAHFGSFENFKNEFKQAATTQFGSGWAWLVWDLADNKLKVIKTSNAETPIVKNLKPLLTIDVWEHAYYLDYQNRRADYIDTFIQHLVNWEFALKNLES
ncbi:MAG: superoxide dismutase [Leptonema sp. (in: bacteria)]